MTEPTVAELKADRRTAACQYCRVNIVDGSSRDPECALCQGTGLIVYTEWDGLTSAERIAMLERENADLRERLESGQRRAA